MFICGYWKNINACIWPWVERPSFTLGTGMGLGFAIQDKVCMYIGM